ncbi:acyltransferase [Fructilactobacillus sp. Tb1]|uniref:acyltransferase n=1 Tax=Fructilactobacillus sp. Tb1 TaxID=3422304 RepID=UPI003D26EA29
MNIISFIEKVNNRVCIRIHKFIFEMKFKGKIFFGKQVKFDKNFSVNINGNKSKFIIGESVTFNKGFSAVVDGEKSDITIGKGAFFNCYCSINALNSVRIGKFTLFGENVKIYDHNHIFKEKEIPISKQGYTSGKIVIGDNCWIGSNVVILKGVTIGDHAIIGAGCVIYKDVPSDSVIVNDQNQIIKRIK